MEEQRKRQLSSPVPSAGSAAQKRKLAMMNNDGSGSSTTVLKDSKPLEESGEDKEEEEGDFFGLKAVGLGEGFLENFRKGALHRQLLESRRDCQRASEKATQLQEQWQSSQARLTEVEQCWRQLVHELRATTGQDQDTGMNGHADDDDEPVTERLQETKRLISALTQGSAGQDGIAKDLPSRYQKLSAELVESRSSHSLLQSILQRTQEELNMAMESLRIAERKLDREQSGSLRKLEKRPEPSASSKTPARTDEKVKVPKKEDGADQAVMDDDDMQEGSSGLSRSEIEELQHLAEARLKETRELRAQKIESDTKLEDYKLRLLNLTEQDIENLDFFKHLKQVHDDTKAVLAEAQEKYDALKAENDQIRHKQSDMEEQIKEEERLERDKLIGQIKATQENVTRIRHERDKKTAEINRLQAQQAEKLRASGEMEKLATSRQSRINALMSEVLRLRAKVAAMSNDGETVNAIAASAEALTSKDGSESAETLPEEEIVYGLRKRLKDAETIAETFREKMRGLTAEAADAEYAEELVTSEARAKEELAAVQRKLDKLQSYVTSKADSTSSADLPSLIKRCEEADDKITQLNTNLKVQEMSTSMLISEVTRLSEAWTQLDSQNSSKILDLAHHERLIQQYVSEKTKAQNKYFQSERDKESVNQQVGVYTRLADQQKRVISNLNEEKVSNAKRLRMLEEELSLREEVVKKHKEKLDALEEAEKKRALEYTAQLKLIADTKGFLAQRTAQCEEEIAARKRVEERCSRLERDAAKYKNKYSSATAALSGQGKFADAHQEQHLKDIERALKCSACRNNYKTHQLKRCTHMFCKSCIDARIETRQRKCPTCAEPFGAADVMMLYW